MSDETTQLSPLKRAFLALQTLQRKVDELQLARTEPIAIVGLGCRVPGADNPDQFWKLLSEGTDAISERPTGRWKAGMVADSDAEGGKGVRWGGYLSSVDTFDAQFFGIAPREAAGMDPQQRLFLEVSWEALENAGIAPDKLKGHPTGVFVGVCTNDYSNLQTRCGDLGQLGTHYASGIAHSIVPGRLSYLLGLSGPSISVDTACSSSLVAVHLACQSLRAGECEMAVAGGVNVILLPDNGVAFSRTGMMAGDGRCKPFDAAADGFVRGEGCGIVVLKRLSRALADGDVIHALIRGSAANQDGASSTMTAPSGPAQEAVMRTALRMAGLEPRDVQCVEAHGTGTVLGDPIELQAIGAALGEGRAPGDAVFVGSVKSNVGHLEASAGVAGLLKMVLALKHKAIPASLHFKTPNPLIAWDRLPVRVPTTLTPWTAASRVAGVSSFGFGGTNAHVIVSEAPAASIPVEPAAVDRPLHVLTLSAPTESGIRTLAMRYASHLEQHPGERAADFAHTANAGRAQFRHRAAMVVSPADDLPSRLRAFADGREDAAAVTGTVDRHTRTRVVFLFSGQGSQYVGMGRRLYETQPTFRRVIDECDALLRDEMQPRLVDVLYPASGQQSPIDQTAYTQPALFALEYALAELWRSWGITPGAVMGHSLGEYVAATVAGILRLEDALRLVTIRGKLSAKLPGGGAMAAVMADAARVRKVLASFGDVVTIAAFNAPENQVISGPQAVVEAVLNVFRAEGVEVRPLAISNAFHARAIEPMLEEFEREAATLTYGAPRVPIYSNLLGRRAEPGEMGNASYWARHLREPVQFAAGFTSVVADGFTTFLEVGPHTILLGLGRQSFPENPGAWLPSLRREYNDWEIILRSAAGLHVAGASVDWTAFDRDYSRRRVVVPSYPFERKRYWADQGPDARRTTAAGPRIHPLVHRRIVSPFLSSDVFETELSLQTLPWLAEHRVLGAAVLPTTAYLEAMWAAGVSAYGANVSALTDVDLHDALVIPDESTRSMQLSLTRRETGGAAIRVVSAGVDQVSDSNAWREHASAGLCLRPNELDGAPIDLDAIRARCARSIPVSQVYDSLVTRGIEHGPAFQGLVSLEQGVSEAIACISAPDALADRAAGYLFHPALLDAALQAVTAAVFDDEDLGGSSVTYMPVAVERFSVRGPIASPLWSHAVRRPVPAGASPIADVRVTDAHGVVVAEIAGLQLRRVDQAAWAPAAVDNDDLYEVQWRALPERASATTAERLAAEHGLDRHAQQLASLDEVCRDLIVEALRTLGWHPATGSRVDGAALADELGIVAQHRRLFDRLLAILAEDGALDSDGGSWIVRRALECGPAAERLAALRSGLNEAAGELGLLGRTGPALAACLTGATDPLSLLFPAGQLDAVDELYRGSPAALVLNGLARQAVEGVVAAASTSAAPIRVLEVGAGTGGTTAAILPALPADRTTYTFTDISPLFLARAEERLNAPGMDYRALDIERDPVAQGFAAGGFDLVIAANVLHATRDLSETLANVRRLVRPGGHLLLLEGTRPQRWIDLTFGLTDGWWRFTDRARRADYPLLTADGWRAALSAAGFESTSVVPAGADSSAANVLITTRIPSATSGRWVVFADAAGTGGALARDLESAGHRVVSVRPGREYRLTDAVAMLPPADTSAYRRLIDELTTGDASVAGVVHLWSLDAAPSDDASPAELRAADELGCRSVLALTQALAGCERTTSSRLVLVTRGTQAVSEGDVPVPVHAPIWGLAGTIRLEHPDLDCLCIDLDGASRAAGDRLLDRILSRGESQLAVRSGCWHVARLAKHVPVPPSPQTGVTSVSLVNTTPGALDGLAFVPTPRRQPGAGEVEIHVTTAALNFRDVLIAMGMYPGATAADRLGGECAGEVLAVGPNVQGVAPGDVVVAMAPGGFGSHVIARAELVLPVPRGLSVEEAVTLPSAFMTAWHALYDLAGLRAGEAVLVHSGAGGLGLAAIQLAKRVGARVLATAGSVEKRTYLSSIGVEHVMDSRSTTYAVEILERTGGRGVDVVLNSLADDHIASSFRALAANGRFVEVGKRGIWSPDHVRVVRPQAKYFVVDLAAVGASDPAAIGAVLRQVHQAVEAGEIAPLPRTAFDASQIAAAFRFMAQAKHVGKIVIRRPHAAVPDRVRADGTYLVTGGTGGLGMVVAGRLIERGAGHVVLMSRRPADAATQQTIDGWNRDGERVSVVAADVSREPDVRAVLARIARTRPTLRGIVHAAGALQDGVLAGQSWSEFSATFGAKVDGTWHLHQLTRGLPLDCFVLFSSISAVFGSPGQGNHAAANAFMDSLAHARRRRGLPALSINWGAWEDVGAATKHDVAGRIGAQGMGTISPRRGTELFDRLMRGDAPRAAVMPVDWAAFAARFAGGKYRESYLAELANGATPARPGREPRAARPEVAQVRRDEPSLRDAPAASRWDLLQRRLASLATRVLALDAGTPLDRDRPLQELGLDSLMAVELRNLIKTECGLDRAPAATIVFDHPTVNALADFVGRTMYGWPAREPVPAAPMTAGDGLDLLDRLEGLTPEEAEQILSERLAGGR
jgi:acyl transferase domain-containing protein